LGLGSEVRIRVRVRVRIRVRVRVWARIWIWGLWLRFDIGFDSGLR
jgi:hypothetical protein